MRHRCECPGETEIRLTELTAKSDSPELVYIQLSVVDKSYLY